MLPTYTPLDTLPQILTDPCQPSLLRRRQTWDPTRAPGLILHPEDPKPLLYLPPADRSTATYPFSSSQTSHRLRAHAPRFSFLLFRIKLHCRLPRPRLITFMNYQQIVHTGGAPFVEVLGVDTSLPVLPLPRGPTCQKHAGRRVVGWCPFARARGREGKPIWKISSARYVPDSRLL